MGATAYHVDHDNDNEQYRNHDSNYGCAGYQRSLMMYHGGVYTLKDENGISDSCQDQTTRLLQSVSAQALLNDVW